MRTAFLVEAGRQVSGSLNLSHTVRRSLTACVPELADWAQLMITGPGHAQYTSLLDDGTTSTARRPLPAADRAGGQGRLLVTGRPEILHVALDGSPDGLTALVPDDAMREQVSALRPADVLGVPLTARGTTFGTLTVARRASAGFDPDDIELATELAARIALAVDAARRYTERSHVASVLQSSLRPPALPALPGVELAARYRPATGDAEIGGDFYDVWGGGDEWSFVLGDVSGKGVEAAVVTGQARHTVRGAAAVDRSPAAVLGALNAMLADTTSGRYVTAIYGRVTPSPAGLRIELGSAGHPPPLLVLPTGEVAPVPVRGMAAGLVDGVRYQPSRLVLAPGETLVVFTDGVTEARDRSVPRGTRRLAELLSRYAGAGVEALAEAIEIAAVEGGGPTQRDDLAVLAIRAV